MDGMFISSSKPRTISWKILVAEKNNAHYSKRIFHITQVGMDADSHVSME